MRINWLFLLISLGCFVILGGNCLRRNPDFGAKLNPPTQVSVIIVNGEIILRWQATTSSSEAEYHIYQSNSYDGPYQEIGQTKVTVYHIPHFKSKTNYYFRITATLNNTAESDPSVIVSVPAMP